MLCCIFIGYCLFSGITHFWIASNCSCFAILVYILTKCGIRIAPCLQQHSETSVGDPYLRNPPPRRTHLRGQLVSELVEGWLVPGGGLLRQRSLPASQRGGAVLSDVRRAHNTGWPSHSRLTRPGQTRYRLLRHVWRRSARHGTQARQYIKFELWVGLHVKLG